MNKQLNTMSLEELITYREELVKQYIGEVNKPCWYFNKLKDINILIDMGNECELNTLENQSSE